MTPEKLGSLIGAVFGLIFVLVNTGDMPHGLGTTLRVLSIAAFGAVLVSAARPDRSSVARRRAGAGFGAGYWLVVTGEVAAIAAGLAVINGPLDSPDVAVAWISFVVGVHFFGLGFVWNEPFFNVLGAAISVCGTVGLVITAFGATPGEIDAVGGVTPGALLLAFALWGSTRGAVAQD